MSILEGKPASPQLSLHAHLPDSVMTNIGLFNYSRSRELGLGIVPMYPTVINEIEELGPEFNGRRFPVSEEIADLLLTIPKHHLVSENYKKFICELFNGMLIQPESSMDHATAQREILTLKT